MNALATSDPLERFSTQLNRRVVGDSHQAESLRICGLQHHCQGGKDAKPIIAGLEGSLDGVCCRAALASLSFATCAA
jgi:hypothetical protein